MKKLLVALLCALAVEAQLRKAVMTNPAHVFVEEDSTTSSFYVWLAVAPTAPVTLTLSFVPVGSIIQILTTTVTFPVASFDLPQAVDLGTSGSITGSGTVVTGLIKFAVTSADTDYNNLAVPPVRYTVWRRPGRVDAFGNVI